MTMLYETFDLLHAFYKQFLAPTVHSFTSPALNLLPQLQNATKQLGLKDEDRHAIWKPVISLLRRHTTSISMPSPS